MTILIFKDYLRHNFLIWFILRICPVNSHNYGPPNFNSSTRQPATSQRCSLVIFILQKGKTPVSCLVFRWHVNNHIGQSWSNFAKLLHDFFFLFGLRYGTNKQTVVRHRKTNPKTSARSDLLVVKFLHGLLSLLLYWVCAEAITSVLACQRIHHKSEVIDSSTLLQYGNQFIFKTISGNFANKDLTTDFLCRTIMQKENKK